MKLIKRNSMKEYYLKNKDKIKEQIKEYIYTNKDKIKLMKKIERKAKKNTDKDKFNERYEEYYFKNKDTIQEQIQEYQDT